MGRNRAGLHRFALAALALAAALLAASPASAAKSGAAEAPAPAAPGHPVPGATVPGAIVHIETLVPGDARTAAALGTTRTGAGAVIDDHGLIVTSAALVTEATAAEVTEADGRTVLASVVGFDTASGLGLLRAAGPLRVKPLAIGRSAALGAEASVRLAVPGRVMPARIVSRRPFAAAAEFLLEHPLIVAPPLAASGEDLGGAALLGGDGRLLGIAIPTLPDQEGAGPAPGTLFAPIDLLEPALAGLLTDGRPDRHPRPWLGLVLAPGKRGLKVREIATESPAEKAGLAAGDLILAIAGTRTGDLTSFYRRLWSLGEAGVAVPLTVEQGGERRELKLLSMDRYRYLKLDTSF